MQERSSYYISREAIPEIRVRCALHMREYYGRFVIGILFYYVMVDVVPDVLGLVFPRSYFDLLAGGLPEQALSQLPAVPYVIFLYNLLLAGAFTLGRAIYALHFLRHQQTEYGRVFDGFSQYIRAALIYLIEMMLVSFGAMAFVIPGVLLFYSYRMAMYLFAEDPSIGILGALSESRRMMQGNKLQLFRLDMSYLFQIALSYMPQLLVLSLTSVDPNTAAGLAVTVVLSIPVYFAMANLYQGEAAFYELLHQKGFANFPYEGEQAFRGPLPELPTRS